MKKTFAADTLLRRAAACGAAAVWACSSTTAQATTGPTPDADAGIPGVYYLDGQRETGSTLELSPDGRFRFEMYHGAVDQAATGAWVFANDQVALKTDEKPAPSFSWIEDQASQAGNCIQGNDTPDTPALVLVACVATPELRLAWENIEVTAEFANGLRRSGKTGYSGQLGFLARSEPEWKGVAITRLTVAYPKGGATPQSFDVPADSKTAVIHLDPGRLIPSAFESVTLRVLHAGSEISALELLTEDGSIWGTFRRSPTSEGGQVDSAEVAVEKVTQDDLPAAGAVCGRCMYYASKEGIAVIQARYGSVAPSWAGVPALPKSENAKTFALVDLASVPDAVKQLPDGTRSLPLAVAGAEDADSVAVLPVLIELPEADAKRKQVARLTMSWTRKSHAVVWLVSGRSMEQLAWQLGRASDIRLDDGKPALLRLADSRTMPVVYDVLDASQRRRVFGMADEWRYVDHDDRLRTLSVRPEPGEADLDQPLVINAEQLVRFSAASRPYRVLAYLQEFGPDELKKLDERRRYALVVEQIKRARRLGVTEDVIHMYVEIALRKGKVAFAGVEWARALERVRSGEISWQTALTEHRFSK